MSEVRFDRKPYFVTTSVDGKETKVRRVPPPRLHAHLPEDQVTITHKKGDDWDKGDKVKVKAVNPRQPNTLMVEKGDGSYTFLPYFDVVGNDKSKNAVIDPLSTDAAKVEEDPLGSRYLLWP